MTLWMSRDVDLPEITAGSGNSRSICSTAGAEEVADVEVVEASLQEVGVENPSADGLTAILLHQTFLKKSSEVDFSTVGHFLKACPDGQGGPAPGPPW